MDNLNTQKVQRAVNQYSPYAAPALIVAALWWFWPTRTATTTVVDKNKSEAIGTGEAHGYKYQYFSLHNALFVALLVAAALYMSSDVPYEDSIRVRPAT